MSVRQEMGEVGQGWATLRRNSSGYFLKMKARLQKMPGFELGVPLGGSAEHEGR